MVGAALEGGKRRMGLCRIGAALEEECQRIDRLHFALPLF